MKAKVLCLILFVCGVAACSSRQSYDVPEQYKQQIVDLRDRNLDLESKRQELQRQIALLDAEKQYNASQIDTIAAQAFNSLGLGGGQYVLNVSSLKIEKRKE